MAGGIENDHTRGLRQRGRRPEGRASDAKVTHSIESANHGTYCLREGIRNVRQIERRCGRQLYRHGRFR